MPLSGGGVSALSEMLSSRGGAGGAGGAAAAGEGIIEVDVYFAADGTSVSVSVRAGERMAAVVAAALRARRGGDADGPGPPAGPLPPRYDIRFMDGDEPDMDMPLIKPGSVLADIGETEFAVVPRAAAESESGQARKRSVLGPPARPRARAPGAFVDRGIVYLRVHIPVSLLGAEADGAPADAPPPGAAPAAAGADGAPAPALTDQDEECAVSFLACGRDDTLDDCMLLVCGQRRIAHDDRLLFRRPGRGTLLDMRGTVDSLRNDFDVRMCREARRVSISRLARQSLLMMMPMDEFAASRYVEYNVVKINRHGSRQQRVIGIDRDKVYNMPPQHCLGMTTAGLLTGAAGLGEAKAMLKHGSTKIMSTVMLMGKAKAGAANDTKKKWRYIRDISSVGFRGDSKRSLEVAFHGKLRELHSYIYEFESTAECTDVLMRISFLTELHTRRRS